MAMWPSVNFHHPSGRIFLPSVSNQAFSYEVHHMSHSDKGHGNKAAAIEPEVCPPVRAIPRDSLSAFQFPRTAIISPSRFPQKCITATCLGAHTASSNSRSSCPQLTLFLPELTSPLSLYRAPWTRMVVKAYLGSV
jgi:hypothetical protein